MRCFKLLSVLLLNVLFLPVAIAQTPVGIWTTIDDKTGKKRAEVRLNVSDSGELTGTIIHVYSQKGDTGVCQNCPGELKGKPIEGLEVLWGLKEKKHGIWTDGHVLDAKSGKIYHAKMTLKGNRLYMRGFVGLSMLGRTQIWVRNTDVS